MGQDQPRVRVAAGQLEGVAAERRDAAPGVHEDRQPPLVGQREQPLDLRMVEREPLGARVQLDPARAAREAALGLGDRIGVRVDAAERHEPAVRGLRLGDDAVVRRRGSRRARAS